MYLLLSDASVSASAVHCLPVEQQQFLLWIAFGFFWAFFVFVVVVVGAGVVCGLFLVQSNGPSVPR